MEDRTLDTKYNMLQSNRSNQSRLFYRLGTASAADTAGAQSAGLSFSNPVYELSNPSAGESTIEELNKLPESVATTASTPPSHTITNTDPLPNVAFKVEHVITPSCTAHNRRFGSFRKGLESRWTVAQAIYPYMVCIALAYCVTLSLYPGIESEIISCNLKSWMPVLLMFMFNTSDVIGKVMASVPYAWSRRQLILLSTMRIALVPLLLLCCAPRSQPIIAGETPAFIFTAALGITNGLAGSLPMMFAPSKVTATLKEATGNMMTLSYNVGLTAGSLIGYVFDSMLGPPIVNPCPKYPFIPMPPSLANVTTTSTTTPVTTTTIAAHAISTILKTTTTIPTTKLLTSTVVPTTISPNTTTGSTSLNSTIASIAVTTLATVISSVSSIVNETNNLFDSTTSSTSTISPSTVLATALFNNSTTSVISKN